MNLNGKQWTQISEGFSAMSSEIFFKSKTDDEYCYFCGDLFLGQSGIRYHLVKFLNEYFSMRNLRNGVVQEYFLNLMLIISILVVTVLVCTLQLWTLVNLSSSRFIATKS